MIQLEVENDSLEVGEDCVPPVQSLSSCRSHGLGQGLQQGQVGHQILPGMALQGASKLLQEQEQEQEQVLSVHSTVVVGFLFANYHRTDLVVESLGVSSCHLHGHSQEDCQQGCLAWREGQGEGITGAYWIAGDFDFSPWTNLSKQSQRHI